MSKQVLNQVEELLPQLSQAERIVVLGRIKILNVNTPEHDVVADVYGMVSTLVGHGTPYLSAKRSKSYKQFVGGVDRLHQFISEVFGKELDFHDKNKMLFLIVRLCLDWMRADKQDMTIWGIAMAFSQVDIIVDCAFPGYRQSGMMADALLSWKQPEK